MERTNKPSDIQAVFFDLDGTLVDTVALIRASMRHTTRSVLGEEISDAVLMAGVGLPLDEQMKAFSEEHADELVRVYREHNDKVHDELVAEYPGIKTVLQDIREHDLPMGVVTSKSKRVALRGLERFGMLPYFDVVVCADDTVSHKPEPQPILHAAERLGVYAENTVYLGDSPFDIRAAKAAGTFSVAVTWGVFDEETLLRERPEYVLHAPEEILGMIYPDEGA